MPRLRLAIALAAGCALVLDHGPAGAGQPPRAADAPDVAMSHRDRVYAAELYSNTVSVTDPVDNKLLGVIRLGDTQPANFSPAYRGELMVHGLGFSPDGKSLAVTAIGSNSVTFVDTATNARRKTVYLGAAPREAVYTPDGKEVWVTLRGEDGLAALDAKTLAEKTRVKVPFGPAMTVFSPDGAYAYVCSSSGPDMVVVSVADRKTAATVRQESGQCEGIAATPDGSQVWLTLRDVGRTMVIEARPPFGVLKVLETGPLTGRVTFARTAEDSFAYVTVGGTNEVKVFRIEGFEPVATIAVGKLPHGLWPSGDGRRLYVGLANGDGVAAIDTASNKVVATVPVGQAPQAVVYVPDAVPKGDGKAGLYPLGVAGTVLQLELTGIAAGPKVPPATSVSLFDQGLTQILQAAVSGLEPRSPYVLALAERRDGTGKLEPLASFLTNHAGAAVVTAAGPIRQLVRDADEAARRYLVITPGPAGQTGTAVQVERAAP